MKIIHLQWISDLLKNEIHVSQSCCDRSWISPSAIELELSQVARG